MIFDELIFYINESFECYWRNMKFNKIYKYIDTLVSLIFAQMWLYLFTLYSNIKFSINSYKKFLNG